MHLLPHRTSIDSLKRFVSIATCISQPNIKQMAGLWLGVSQKENARASLPRQLRCIFTAALHGLEVKNTCLQMEKELEISWDVDMATQVTDHLWASGLFVSSVHTWLQVIIRLLESIMLFNPDWCGAEAQRATQADGALVFTAHFHNKRTCWS